VGKNMSSSRFNELCKGFRRLRTLMALTCDLDERQKMSKALSAIASEAAGIAQTRAIQVDKLYSEVLKRMSERWSEHSES
jgi:hypothetical protein